MPRRGQCTHMTATQVHHGNLTCNMCGRIPNTGWVYACTQDQDLPPPRPSGDLHLLHTFEKETNTGDALEDKARVAEFLGLKPDVVGSMRAGHYTFAQIEILLDQKIHLIKVLQQAEKDLRELAEYQVAEASKSTGDISDAKDEAPRLPHIATRMRSASTPTDLLAKVKEAEKCKFRVCATCRPYFNDRVYTSVESVLYGEIVPLSETELGKLRVMDRNICLNMGLRKPMVSPSPNPFLQKRQDSAGLPDDQDDSMSTDWSQTSSSDDGIDDFPCPGPNLCTRWIPETGVCAYDHGFDDGKRGIAHSYTLEPPSITPEHSRSHLGHSNNSLLHTPARSASTASSISLPTPESKSKPSPLTPRACVDDSALSTPTFLVDGKKAHSFNEVERRLAFKASRSSLGSEVEVDGGVALTEEAVGMGLPDIVV